MKQTVDLNQFVQAMGAIPQELEAAVLKGLRSTAMRGVSVVVGEIDAAGAVNTGSLRQSVKWKPEIDGATLEVDAPHAAFVEYGTRPHWPPGAPIFAWVMRKGLAATEYDGIQITRAIQASIAKNGTKPRHYFKKAMKKIYGQILPQEVTREVNKI